MSQLNISKSMLEVPSTLLTIPDVLFGNKKTPNENGSFWDLHDVTLTQTNPAYTLRMFALVLECKLDGHKKHGPAFDKVPFHKCNRTALRYQAELESIIDGYHLGSEPGPEITSFLQ
jgi:hypothetical protein